MKPKQLQFKKGEPFLSYYTEKAEIEVLTMVSNPDKPAYYEIRPNQFGMYQAMFWAMNRGIPINLKCKTIDEAKMACQDHFNRLVLENCE